MQQLPVPHPAEARDASLLAGFTPQNVRIKTENFSTPFKRALWLSGNQRCAYCGDLIESYKAMHVDHFVASANGGRDEIDNLIGCCCSCNCAKRDRGVEHLRQSLRLKMSPCYGIIITKQMLELEAIGAKLPVGDGYEFHFEMVLRQSLAGVSA